MTTRRLLAVFDLLIRGMCCLRPGIKGVSENIRVISIVGRYLEYSRIYYFYNNGNDEIYMGNANLMPRNLNPVSKWSFPSKLNHRSNSCAISFWKPASKTIPARILKTDGSYERAKPFDVQHHLMGG